jgi:hypothetical protein
MHPNNGDGEGRRKSHARRWMGAATVEWYPNPKWQDRLHVGKGRKTRPLGLKSENLLPHWLEGRT